MTIEQSTVAAILRCTQALCQQISDKQTLEHGIAFYSRLFANLADANQFREVVAENDAGAALEEADRFFRQQDLTCHRWAPAMGRASPQLSESLLRNGFVMRTHTALVLTDRVDLLPADRVRIVHARALRAHFRRTFLDQPPSPLSGLPDSTAARELLADAAERRLDDPQYDMFVALLDNRPAGRAALYQVGDLALVNDLFVLDPFTGHAVDRTLLAHLLALARRLAMRKVFAQVDDADPTLRELLDSAGFTPDGAITEFHRTARP